MARERRARLGFDCMCRWVMWLSISGCAEVQGSPQRRASPSSWRRAASSIPMSWPLSKSVDLFPLPDFDQISRHSCRQPTFISKCLAIGRRSKTKTMARAEAVSLR